MKLVTYFLVNLALLVIGRLTTDYALELGLVVRIVGVLVFFISTWWLGLGRRFGLLQWQLFQAVIAFGLWPILVLAYLVFMPDSFPTQFALGTMGTPENGLLAHDYIFTMLFVVCVTYAACERMIRHNGDSVYAFNKETLLAGRNGLTVIALGLVVVGTAIMLILPYVPKRISQIAVLFSWIRYWGMFYLVIIWLAARGSSPGVRFKALVMALLGIGFSGIVVFLQGGQKGQLIVQLFVVFLLVVTYDWRLGLKVGAVCFAFMLCLVPLLPHINAVKNQLQRSGGDIATTGLGSRMGLLMDKSSTERDTMDVLSAADYFGVYLVNRVALTHMTATYVGAYRGRELGFRSLLEPISVMVPRFFNPGKMDLDIYYNDLARNSGIGGRDDVETSRKPSLVDEAIYTGGFKGVVVFGIFFGLLLYGLDWLIRLRIFRPTVGLAIAVTMAVANMMAYVGVIFGSLPYHVIFFALCGVVFLNWVVSRLDWNQVATLVPDGHGIRHARGNLGRRSVWQRR